MSTEQKVAVVTGASRGIGQAIALELGKNQGAIVAGTATSEAGAEKITAYLNEAGIQGKGYCLQVTDDSSIEAFIKAVQEDFGAPVILVNNAGITRDNLLMRMKPEEWEEVINTNLTSVFKMTKALVRGMTKARWGRIVNVSSVVASSGNMGQTNYAASKAGIEGYTRAMAIEVGSRGITVNSVAPGFIDTDMTRNLDEAHAEVLKSKIPLGRYGGVEEVASVVGFLVSEPAGYVTGETVHVNGGMYMG
jgi:3-oxoacyl-[acyl-carrier protein] reductase